MSQAVAKRQAYLQGLLASDLHVVLLHAVQLPPLLLQAAPGGQLLLRVAPPLLPVAVSLGLLLLGPSTRDGHRRLPLRHRLASDLILVLILCVHLQILTTYTPLSPTLLTVDGSSPSNMDSSEEGFAICYSDTMSRR